MLKFAANVNMMFNELPSIAQRIFAAKKAGFEAVEITMPYIEKKEPIAEALRNTGIQCVLINASSVPGYFGLAVDPDKKAEFREKLELSIEYAKAFQCPRMHILAGCPNHKYPQEKAEDTYVENIRYAADRLKKENITILAEFINSLYTVKDYFLDSPEKALQLIEKVDRGDQVQFQLDLFHLQLVKGDLSHNIEKYLPKTGYMQVSQVPHRGEPFSLGEIDYHYIFDLLTKLKYTQWIGLEYKPRGNTEEGLKMMQQLKYLSINNT